MSDSIQRLLEDVESLKNILAANVHPLGGNGTSILCRTTAFFASFVDKESNIRPSIKVPQ
jgi:hypothetical protein